MELKVGDIIERCTLMPAIIQKIDDDCLTTFDYAYINSPTYKGGSQCSINNCGVRKISHEFALKLILIGREKLGIINESVESGEEYDKLVNEEYDKIINLYK